MAMTAGAATRNRGSVLLVAAALILSACSDAPAPGAATLPVNRLPTVDAGLPQAVDEGAAVTLAGTATDPEDGANLALTWRQIGGPAAVNPSGADTATLRFTAPDVSGDTVLQFELRAQDSAGGSATDAVAVTVHDLDVPNAPPVADAGDDLTVDAGDAVALDGSASHDAEDGSNLTYAWTQLEGPAVVLSDAAAARPGFRAPEDEAGATLRFSLTVTDTGNASHADEVVITVRPLPDLTQWVEPFIGSYPPGFINPGPVAPFGMVNLGPDTEGPLNYGGYSVQNATIHGFSHVHMSSGAPKGGQIPVMPFVGDVTPGDPNQLGWPNPAPAYGSPFDRVTEVADAGYYKAILLRYGVTAELTATERAGFHRYTYALPDTPRLLFDVSRDLTGYNAAEASLGGDGVLSGSVATQGYRVFFAARFSAPFTAQTLAGEPLGGGGHATGKSLGVLLDFPELSGPLLVKVGISYVDAPGALRNLDAEIPGWDFDRVRADARRAWNRALARIRVEGGTDIEKTSFYSALFRLQQFPNLLSDVDGRYPGPDGAIHADVRPHYTQFSLWDSYRGQNAMLAEIVPDRYRDMVNSLLDFKRQGGALPRWQQAGKDAGHMSGDPVIPFIGEAWCRGGVDADTREELFDAMKALVEARAGQIALGYRPVARPSQPFEQIKGGPSGAGTTLEYGIADFALALMAKQKGDSALAAQLSQQSLNYRNLQDPETGWIRPRHDDGGWLTPFAPELGYGFQEGTSWQYSWLAMHDLAGLYERMGGTGQVEQRLDTFFNFPADLAVPIVWPAVQNQATVFGLFYYGNQFAPGNEHDLQAPYLYSYLGLPWKTQAVARAAASIYTPTPNGLPGNDDLGALSGWLLWTMAGVYPMNPGTPLVVVGSPMFEKITIRRPGGDLVIEAPGASILNKFVQDVTLDGRPLAQSWFVLPRGASTVNIGMGPVPNLAWGTAPGARPPSLTTDGLDTFGCAP